MWAGLLVGCGGNVDLGGQALALTWGGPAGTQIDLDSFIESDHTITVRFAPQYPFGPTQAVLGENGGGAFMLGIGWNEDLGGTEVVLDVGSESQRYPLAVDPDTWMTAALVGRIDGLTLTYDVWVDGSLLEPPVSVSVNDLEFPTGSIRLGQRTTGAPGPVRQYYGLIDDLAVYGEALRERDLERRTAADYVLRGSERSLIATLTFESDENLPEAVVFPNGPGHRGRGTRPHVGRRPHPVPPRGQPNGPPPAVRTGRGLAGRAGLRRPHHASPGARRPLA